MNIVCLCTEKRVQAARSLLIALMMEAAGISVTSVN
jgi:hypothetical protein